MRDYDIVDICMGVFMLLLGTALIIGGIGVYTGEIYFPIVSHWTRIVALLFGLSFGIMMWGFALAELWYRIVFLIKSLGLLLKRK